MTASYVGNVDRHNFNGTGHQKLNQARFVPGSSNTNENRPYFAAYGWTQDLSYYCNCANEEYNSLQQYRSRLQGLTVQGSYTYQRQWGGGWGYDGTTISTMTGKRARAIAIFLPRNQITVPRNLRFPFGHGRKYGSQMNRAVDFALGGWTISGITNYYSGFGFSPTPENYGPNAQPNAGPNNRPDIGRSHPFSGAKGDRSQWFVGGVGSAFLFPASNTFETILLTPCSGLDLSSRT